MLFLNLMDQHRILVLGAGRSSSVLIRYLLREGEARGWTVTVADADEALARQRVAQAANGQSLYCPLSDENLLRSAIRASDLVISLVPAGLHPAVAAICLNENRHMLTASYVSPAMQALHPEAQAKGLLFLNECGLDPGLDHMSALAVIHRLQGEGYTLTSFESYTGGLIDPASDPDNPWRYRFTWNPRNVVVAGQGTARFRWGGMDKFIPYHQLFHRVTPIEVAGVGWVEGYANRDSLQYQELYGLRDIATLIRGTLRFQGFCSAWNVLVQLGCTEDSYPIDGVQHLTHAGFIERFVPADAAALELRVARLAGVAASGDEMAKLKWAGFFRDDPVGLAKGTPAQITEHILAKCWALQPGHRDLVVMWHRFQGYRDNQRLEIQSSFSATGDACETAMARTVGLPLAIAAKLLLTGKLKQRGVVVPVHPDVYQPILTELQTHHIRFTEHERLLTS